MGGWLPARRSGSCPSPAACFPVRVPWPKKDIQNANSRLCRHLATLYRRKLAHSHSIQQAPRTGDRLGPVCFYYYRAPPRGRGVARTPLRKIKRLCPRLTPSRAIDVGIILDVGTDGTKKTPRSNLRRGAGRRGQQIEPPPALSSQAPALAPAAAHTLSVSTVSMLTDPLIVT